MSEMSIPADDLVVIGKTVSVYGIRGEVKVYSSTDPLDNPLDYRHWTFRRDGEIWQTELVRGRLHDKVLVAKPRGFGDREEVHTFIGCETCISHSESPFLEEGEHYWHQLEGLKVTGQGGQLLGVIDHLLETGANDVMVVKPCAGNSDGRERPLPYTGRYVLSIDLVTGETRVDWDTDF